MNTDKKELKLHCDKCGMDFIVDEVLERDLDIIGMNNVKQQYITCSYCDAEYHVMYRDAMLEQAIKQAETKKNEYENARARVQFLSQQLESDIAEALEVVTKEGKEDDE